MGKGAARQTDANLLFVGPPATGKTELAKALAEYLFGDEKNMLRFDCSEFRAQKERQADWCSAVLSGCPQRWTAHATDVF